MDHFDFAKVHLILRGLIRDIFINYYDQLIKIKI